MMAAVPVMGLALSVLGCGGSVPGLEYDPETDVSQIIREVGERRLDTPKGGLLQLRVHLRGRGRYPASWRSSLEVSARAEEQLPDLLGDTPTLVVSPDLPAKRSFEAERQHHPTERLFEVHDSAAFDVPINELLYMVDRSRGLELNGTPWDLTDADKKVIRDAIVGAKQLTDAGR